MNDKLVLTVLGSRGGVARAVLSLLNRAAQDTSDPIHSLISQCELHLIDRKRNGVSYYRNLFPSLWDRIHVHRFSSANIPRLKQHLEQSGTRIVIDVSWGDTVETLRCCDELGVRYVNTALENTMIDKQEEMYRGFPLIERVRIFDRSRESFTNTAAIVCSGMNPGVVQWMAIELMRQHPARRPLACYVVEHDSSFFADPSRAKPDTIYTTWSPECFLDEAILCYPMFVKHHTPLFLHEPVYAVEFKVSLGPIHFNGRLMPHEEILSLCRLYDLEGGFLYRINAHTTELILRHLDNPDTLWDMDMAVLDPQEAPLVGEDLVGVLLVFDDHEAYMYNVMSNQAIFAEYGVNATYFQVACGVYAALATLLLDRVPLGIYYVDELLLSTECNYGKYLSHYMHEFVIGVNAGSDGLLLQRMCRSQS